MKDALKQYVTLRKSLLEEKAELESRLSEINEALAMGESATPVPAPVTAVSASKRRRVGRPRRRLSAAAAGPTVSVSAPAAPTKRGRGGRRLRNALSLKDAILKVTHSAAKTKEEILTDVQKLGYRFTTSNPLASINAVLYAKHQFRNVKGRFSPA